MSYSWIKDWQPFREVREYPLRLEVPAAGGRGKSSENLQVSSFSSVLMASIQAVMWIRISLTQIRILDQPREKKIIRIRPKSRKIPNF